MGSSLQSINHRIQVERLRHMRCADSLHARALIGRGGALGKEMKAVAVPGVARDDLPRQVEPVLRAEVEVAHDGIKAPEYELRSGLAQPDGEAEFPVTFEEAAKRLADEVVLHQQQQARFPERRKSGGHRAVD